jgi:hypothetical protein
VVRIKVDWPSDLCGKELRLYIEFRSIGITYQPSLTWGLVTGGPPFKNILCGPGAKQTIPDNKILLSWRFSAEDERATQSGEQKQDRNRVYAAWGESGSLSVAESLETEPGGYSLHSLIVLRHCESLKGPFEGEQLEVIAGAEADQSNLSGISIVDSSVRQTGNLSIKAVPVSPSYWCSLHARWQVAPGKVNEWIIPLPDELTKAVREALKADTAPKPK